MIHFFHLSTALTKQMSTLSHSEVICMQKPQTDMKPGFKKQMFLPFKASVGKAQSSRSVIQPAAAASGVGAYRDDGHSCGGAAELGPRVKVLLDFPSHGQLVLVFWRAVILGNASKCVSSVVYVHVQMWFWRTEPTLTHGWSSTCVAVYLWSTSTCSIAVITA